MGEDGKSKEDGADQSGKHPQNEITASQGNQIMSMPPQGWYPHEEDEIDLADLAGILYRRKWLIFGVTLVFACLAFGASSMMTEKFEASSMLEIGMLVTEDGYENVEASQAAKNRMASLAKAVAGKMRKEMETDGDDKALGCSVKDLKIDAPDNGTIVSVSLTAPKESKALEILSKTNQRLIADHNRIFSQRRTELENRIARHELTLKDMDISISDMGKKLSELAREYERKTVQKENLIAELTRSINNMDNRISELKRQYEVRTGLQSNIIKELESQAQNLEARKKFINEKIKLLQEEKKDLEGRINEAEARYAQLVNSRLAASEDVESGTALGLMLFSSEAQHLQNYLSQLRDRLLLKIPEAIKELETNFQEIDTRISGIMSEKNLEEKRLGQLEPELNEKIEELKAEIEDRKAKLELEIKLLEQMEPEFEDKAAELEGKIKNLENKKQQVGIDIRELQNRVENMIVTGIIVPPEFSDRRVSPNLKLNVALGLVAGFFLAVFAAFLAEFWQRNREKIKSGK